MKVFGGEVTPDQLDAGRAAMTTSFVTLDIVGALHRAGVPWFTDQEISSTAKPDMPAYEAANRLLQKERKAGVIKHRGGGKWTRV